MYFKGIFFIRKKFPIRNYRNIICVSTLIYKKDRNEEKTKFLIMNIIQT